jgi:cytochrome c peroxidase
LSARTRGAIGSRLGRFALIAMLIAPAGPDATRPIVTGTAAEPGRADLRRAYARPTRQWPAPSIDAGVAFVELGPLKLPPPPDQPERSKIELGEQLFRDQILSAGRDVACITCHDPQHGWSTSASFARRDRGSTGPRNPPSLSTVAFRRSFAWDGREESLAAQSLSPLTQHAEMGNDDLAAVLGRLQANAHYAARFASPYGSQAVSPAELADALAAFQSRLETPTRFDRFAAGEHGLLTDQEIRGLHLFRTKARCANCHFGPLLTDERYHNLKISSFGEPAQDLGRHDVSGAADDAGRFRTPSLRHVASTAPYMHNGLFPTLEGVINLYDRGGGEVWARNATEASAPLYPFAAHLSPHIRRLDLSPDEKAALAAFLRAL